MSLISVEDAVARMLAGVTRRGEDTVPLAKARGRVLACDLSAKRNQPPFRASAMDGYAVRAEDTAAGAVLRQIGEARAGSHFSGTIGTGETVRIFTGAPVPAGANAILIQENARADGECIEVLEPVAAGRHIRAAAFDFREGETLLPAGRRIGTRETALAAAMNHAVIAVAQRPIVAILSTGDELVEPGEEPGPDQIVSSNGMAIAAMVAACGGVARDLGVVIDDKQAIVDAAAGAKDADILVVIGGASVGDHDLVQPALSEKGLKVDFWRVAMRPGKPVMFGTLGRTRVLGLPGNPVSALICALVFLKPLIAAMQGAEGTEQTRLLPLAAALPEVGDRQQYLRARFIDCLGRTAVTVADDQDSSLLATLARCDALIIRPPFAPEAKAGDVVSVIDLAQALS
ncbi:molybdopterin molybdotransferase [Rhodopseudomonas julia]|uniref:Molybdopterin molybdenumtransferase n=1 Tax=Rhodopseudomonas julia TaxID=200617 RepID=A0ABU0C9U0_9BRAD|nr:gephyrin-like molybdotransferase Glp [Rhodopseudomonas julia]MDQ0327299.1 molybdopterin molybdotransferase [Rhodopseudomonas julia]